MNPNAYHWAIYSRSPPSRLGQADTENMYYYCEENQQNNYLIIRLFQIIL